MDAKGHARIRAWIMKKKGRRLGVAVGPGGVGYPLGEEAESSA